MCDAECVMLGKLVLGQQASAAPVLNRNIEETHEVRDTL